MICLRLCLFTNDKKKKMPAIQQFKQSTVLPEKNYNLNELKRMAIKLYI